MSDTETARGAKLFLSARDVAKRMEVSIPTVYKMAYAGLIPVVKIGLSGVLRFRSDDIEAMMQSQVLTGDQAARG